MLLQVTFLPFTNTTPPPQTPTHPPQKKKKKNTKEYLPRKQSSHWCTCRVCHPEYPQAAGQIQWPADTNQKKKKLKKEKRRGRISTRKSIYLHKSQNMQKSILDKIRILTKWQSSQEEEIKQAQKTIQLLRSTTKTACMKLAKTRKNYLTTPIPK